MNKNSMAPWVRYEYKYKCSMLCPECHKIMEPTNKNAIISKLICKDCNVIIEPKISDLRKVRGEFKMATYEIKAIDMACRDNNVVKFNTVDYFPNLIRVEYGDTKFIVDRNDMKDMIEKLQIVKEDNNPAGDIIYTDKKK